MLTVKSNKAWLATFLSLLLALALVSCGESTAASTMNSGTATGAPLSQSANKETPQIKVQAGFTAPDFTVTTISGETVQLSQLRGKAVIINFWSVYCPSCRQETPDFVEAYNKNKANLVIIGINWGETESEVKGFMEEFRISFPITIDKTGDMITTFRVPYHPHSIFINKEGVISGIVPGLVSPEMMKTQLARIL